MEEKKGRQIIFWGDSNTYGYDPADMDEMRYPADVRWTDVLQKKAGDTWRVFPEGLNGRRLPKEPESSEILIRLLKAREEDGVFAVMLGTNDVLQGAVPDASDAISRMDRLLSFVDGKCPRKYFLVIGPVYSGSEDSGDDFCRAGYRESVRMNSGFRELAAKYRVLYVNAGAWGVETAFDMVHFSAKGSLTFAERMEKTLARLEEYYAEDRFI